MAETEAEARALERARRPVAAKLKGFSPTFPDDLDPWDMNASKPAAEAFPVPELVLFTLRNLMGWGWQGPGEKVRWSVYGSVDGEPVGFELRKFGFAILRTATGKVSNARIIGQLQSAIRQVERLLEPFAKAQIEVGEVMIANRHGEFEARYRFFRQAAEAAFERADAPPEKNLAPNAGSPSEVDVNTMFSGFIAEMNRSHAATREGFFYSAAMVDAYFSSLEHRLVLLRAFLGQPIAPGGVMALLQAKWDGKFKAVIPEPLDLPTQALLSQMRRIKERIRNPFSHGGVENDGGSLFFHLPNIGALPANFTRFGESVRFSFHPIDADSHAQTCQAFDAFDELLSSGPLSGPHRFVDSGVDPSFDPETLKRYASAIAGGDEAIENFIGRWSHRWQQHANMDY